MESSTNRRSRVNDGGRSRPWQLALALASLGVLASAIPLGAQRRPEMIPEMDRSLIGRTAPEIEGQRLEGAASFQLSELRGTPVIVAFWASWCSPCRYELPALSAFMRGQRDVEAIAVNVDRTREEALAFLARTPLDIPVVLDSRAVSLGRYGVTSMPTTFLVDAYGTVKWKRVGFNREHGIEELADTLEAIR